MGGRRTRVSGRCDIVLLGELYFVHRAHQDLNQHIDVYDLCRRMLRTVEHRPERVVLEPCTQLLWRGTSRRSMDLSSKNLLLVCIEKAIIIRWEHVTSRWPRCVFSS